MKKNYFLTLILTLVTAISFGQGSENFASSNATASYADNSFTGNNGITWTYVASRNANGDGNNSGISLPALMLRRVTSGSKITSSTISGGIGDFSVKLYKGFTGGGDRQVELFINSISKGTSTAFDDNNLHTFEVNGINEGGEFTLEIKNTTGRQVIIDDIIWTAFAGVATPSIGLSSPATDTTFDSGTSSVDVVWATNNTTTETVDIIVNGNRTEGVTSPFSIPTTDGEAYTVNLELINGGNVTDMATTNFSVELPCDLQLGSITTSCNAETSGIDTYTISIPFTNGNTSTYTLTADSGMITGDNPSTTTSGTITITGVNENTNVVFTAKGDASNSSCDLLRNITSPTCVSATCSTTGTVIITEIMRNPNFVLDANGEYFEVYNTTSSDIDMIGWVLKDNGSELHTIGTSVVVPANGFAVLGNNADISTNGGVTINYEYSGFGLSNSGDEIIIDCGGTVIDIVDWDSVSGFPSPNGKSIELIAGKYNATANDVATNWQEAIDPIVAGGDSGTPGTGDAPVASIENQEITGFKAYPNPVKNNILTISSSSSNVKKITLYNVLGRKVLTKNFSGTQKTISVAGINSGIYILKVVENGKTSAKKLVIE